MRRERALGDERSIVDGLGTPLTLALMMLAAHNVPVRPSSRAIGGRPLRQPLHECQGAMLGVVAARVGRAGTRVDQHVPSQGGAGT